MVVDNIALAPASAPVSRGHHDIIKAMSIGDDEIIALCSLKELSAPTDLSFGYKESLVCTAKQLTHV